MFGAEADILQFADILGTDEELDPDMDVLCATMHGREASTLLPDWTPRTAAALDAPPGLIVKQEPTETLSSTTSFVSSIVSHRSTTSLRLLPGRSMVTVSGTHSPRFAPLCVHPVSFLTRRSHQFASWRMSYLHYLTIQPLHAVHLQYATVGFLHCVWPQPPHWQRQFTATHVSLAQVGRQASAGSLMKHEGPTASLGMIPNSLHDELALSETTKGLLGSTSSSQGMFCCM